MQDGCRGVQSHSSNFAITTSTKYIATVPRRHPESNYAVPGSNAATILKDSRFTTSPESTAGQRTVNLRLRSTTSMSIKTVTSYRCFPFEWPAGFVNFTRFFLFKWVKSNLIRPTSVVFPACQRKRQKRRVSGCFTFVLTVTASIKVVDTCLRGVQNLGRFPHPFFWGEAMNGLECLTMLCLELTLALSSSSVN